MLLYNSPVRRKEEFIPVTPGHARVYVCGITAYDYSHIGHARSAIVFDVLVRQLRHLGFETLFIRNFTDIDDKIIKRANEEGRDWREVGATYMAAFHEDMERLGVRRPDLEPRATDYIPQIITLCEELIAKGHAYATPSGDVYFSVRSYEPYGRLSGRNLDELRVGARVAPGEEKRDALDFAIWKAAKPGEPSWDSPWGWGRPGWHIECSAMNQPYLPLDIHGGGMDLLFPHHENEVAQTEAACNCILAKYWMHNGFVRIDSEKMAKSLGNFKTIRDVLKDWRGETLRFFLLGKHYRSPIDFTFQGLLEADRGQKRVYTALADAADAIGKTAWKDKQAPADILAEWEAAGRDFAEAMADDLNTALAIGHIFTQCRIVNRLLEAKATKTARATGKILEEFLERARIWEEVLGVFGRQPREALAEIRDFAARRANLDQNKVQELLDKRANSRKAGDFAASDAIRAELAAMGVIVRDTPAGQTWDME